MDFSLNAKACWGGVTKQENMTHFGLLPPENESSHLHSWSQPVQIPSGSYSFLYVVPYSHSLSFSFYHILFLLPHLGGRSCPGSEDPRTPSISCLLLGYLVHSGHPSPAPAFSHSCNLVYVLTPLLETQPPSAALDTWTFIEAQSSVLRPFLFTVLQAFIHLLGCTHHSSAEDPEVYISRLISWDY